MSKDIPAFPHQFSEGMLFTKCHHGLTIRDYLAGQALMGLLAKSNCTPGRPTEDYAKFSYEYADAMLEERAK